MSTTEELERCDHPWHRNPALINPCPQCGDDGTGRAPKASLPYGGYDFAKPSFAVVASANGRGVVLWHVGGHVALEFDGGDMAAEDVGLDPPEDGIWVWEGKLKGGSGPTWYNPDGEDASLEGSFRPPTDEEWSAIRANESPKETTQCERRN